VHRCHGRSYRGAMTDFIELDLSGARFERVNLANVVVNGVDIARSSNAS
jgi:uncharacterized protein YjbI with pentapeptide repeats